jgi:predicted phosphodiesterase
MRAVTTVIVSDLHLGAASGRDLLRRPAVLAALVGALDGIEELVLLGDVLELRELPLQRVLAAARPALAEIGRSMAGGRITVVAGNHDHQLAASVVDAARAGGGALELETLGRPPAGDHGVLGELARALAPAEVRVAYPGVWVRGDVYATHGHYLDAHNVVPSFERLASALVQRLTGRVPEGDATPDDYERALAPQYALAYALAQHAPGDGPLVRADRSARARERLAGDGPRPLGARLAAGVGVPAVVRALNAAGLGPLEADLSGVALREAALRAMRTVLDRLRIDAPHVVFGHTHRSGPHARDEGWGRLVNCGSWVHEPTFLGARPLESPYFPGHCVLVGGSGPPELRRLVEELPV